MRLNVQNCSRTSGVTRYELQSNISLSLGASEREILRINGGSAVENLTS